MNPKDPRHFFATSLAEWRTSTDIKKLIRQMDAGGMPYHLWLVPGNEDDDYEIENYLPQVKGIIFLTTIHPKTK